MVTISDNLIGNNLQSNIVLRQGSIIDYKSEDDMIAQHVLISLPTIVLVRSGIKKFKS